MSVFWEMSGAVPLSGKMRHQLEQDRGVSFATASGLRMIARQRLAGDRSVTDFRVFDPAALAGIADEPRRFDDLAPEAVLHAGLIEQDGTIVLSS